MATLLELDDLVNQIQSNPLSRRLRMALRIYAAGKVRDAGASAGVTLRQALRAIAAYCVGDGDGYDGATVTFDAIDNAGTQRIEAAVTAEGRTVTLTL